jgi:hypothetical protein
VTGEEHTEAGPLTFFASKMHTEPSYCPHASKLGCSVEKSMQVTPDLVLSVCCGNSGLVMDQNMTKPPPAPSSSLDGFAYDTARRSLLMRFHDMPVTT